MSLKRGMIPPNKNLVKQRFAVNRPDQQEAIYQPLYDFQTYAAAGATQMQFFTVPQGQSSKTYADTNMDTAGSLPAPKSMLVTGIQVVFWSGAEVSVLGAAATNKYWMDVHAIAKSGYLKFFIGSKDYLVDAPIGKFPPDFKLGGVAATSDATTAAAALNLQIGYASVVGPAYEITPVELVSNQNFNVTLNWPTAVATPSTVAGRIGVILVGFQYRLSQ